jgi:hypothetical protein
MATLNEMFPGKYLRALEDVPEDGLRDTITDLERVEMKTKTGATELKWVLFFAQLEKGLVLNITNARTLARAFGDDTDGWTGKVIDLVVREVEFSGKIVPAIRISIPKAAKATA